MSRLRAPWSPGRRPAAGAPRATGVATLAILLFIVGAAPARADRFEASIHGTVVGGLARVAQRGTPVTVTVPTAGASVRLAHAWRNALAWDLQLAGAALAPASFRDIDTTLGGRPVRADITRRTHTVALQLGAQLRLGARWIPTLRVSVGPQLRRRSGYAIDGAGAVPADVDLDAVATVGAGLERRLGAHLLVGMAVEATRARPVFGGVGLDTLGLTVTVSRAWYPRVWGPTW